MRRSLLLPLFLALPTLEPAHAGTGDTFADAREVIERRCLSCHGGDHRESGLSFATAETFALGGSRGPAVRADDPARSRLLEVVSYRDPSLAMPPQGVLPEDERAALERWVTAGAPWPEGDEGRLADPDAHPLEVDGPREVSAWWAYDPLVRPPLPPGDAEHPLDRHVEARLAAEGLERAGRARPETLLRRASFKLTGLPPSAALRDRFLGAVARDGFDAAWAALLDELLEDPQYGVAQARRWLDLVRYAETNGYERDNPKLNVWRYRDWVVRAFNQDLPYDEFASLQLAGDELVEELEDPADRADALLATGVHRLGVWDDEPVDRGQARSDERADIVDTFSVALFGTTMGCARCHDHKADPVTQREYFELTAHFRGLEGQNYSSHRPVADPPGPGMITIRERDARRAELDARLAAALDALPPDAPTPSPEGEVLIPDARGGAPVTWRLARRGPFDGWAAPGFDDSDWEEGPAGFGRKGTPASVVGTDWHQKHILLRTTFQLDRIPAALRLSLHHDDDVRVFINGVPVMEREGYIVEYMTVQLGPSALDALVVGRNVIAVQCEQDFGGQYIDVGLDTGFDPDAEGAPWAWAHEVIVSGADEDGAFRGLVDQKKTLEDTPIAEPYPAQIAFEGGPRPGQQHVELRGSVHALGEPVEPALPAAWTAGSAPDSAPYAPAGVRDSGRSSGRRSALAAWAFDGGRHVTARVEANRLFQWLFGRGLCRTPGDFGRLGERPTHPELLDELSLGLVERGWSRKEWLRWVMSSEAFLASSSGPAASFAADPRNDLLWRFDPARLSAEEFRDAALAASGELNTRLEGPWIFPPMAAEVRATASRPNAAWGRSSPEDAARRSLYVHVKRSLREPLLAVLDQPDPDLPCSSRFLTNVPTQALLTLNGDFAQRRARTLAAKVMGELGEDAALDELAEGCVEGALARPAGAEEVSRARALLASLQRDHGLDRAGALALFCLGLFNRNEFLWID